MYKCMHVCKCIICTCFPNFTFKGFSF